MNDDDVEANLIDHEHKDLLDRKRIASFILELIESSKIDNRIAIEALIDVSVCLFLEGSNSKKVFVGFVSMNFDHANRMMNK